MDREFKYAPEMYGIRFPSTSLRPAAQAGKYVTSNDPTTLVLLGVFGRNLSRDFSFVVDLSGAVYHGELRTGKSRFLNQAWQRYALDVFRGGDLMIMNRHAPGATPIQRLRSSAVGQQ